MVTKVILGGGAVLFAAWAARAWRRARDRRQQVDALAWHKAFRAHGGAQLATEPTYDQAKALTGAKQARRQTASGRPYAPQGPGKGETAAVVPIRRQTGA